MALIGLIALTVGGPAMAADESVETVPDDVRRTTLIVRDIDRSLVLYRDILGFRPWYDNEIVVTGAGLPAGEPNSDTRLVILRGSQDWIGMIGLLEFKHPPLPDPGDYPTRLAIGDVVFVLNTADVDAAFERIKALDGVTVQRPPHTQSYPSADGQGTVRVRGMTFFDPDGYFFELNERLD